MAVDELRIDLSAGRDTLNPALTAVNQKLDQAVDESKRVESEGGDALRGFGRSWTELASKIDLAKQAIGAVTAVARGVVGVMDDFARQETGIRQLGFALRQHGIEWGSVRDRVEATAAELQATTRFGDDVTRRMLSQFALATQGLNVGLDAMLESTRLIQDIVEITGRSADSVARAVGQALGGELMGLRRLVPPQLLDQLEAIEDDSERGAAAIDALRESYGGLSTQLSGTELDIAKVTNAWGDFREQLGELFAKILAEGHVMDSLLAVIEGLVTTLAENTPAIVRHLQTIAGAIADIVEWGEKLVNLDLEQALLDLIPDLTPFPTHVRNLSDAIFEFSDDTRDAVLALQEFNEVVAATPQFGGGFQVGAGAGLAPTLTATSAGLFGEGDEDGGRRRRRRRRQREEEDEAVKAVQIFGGKATIDPEIAAKEAKFEREAELEAERLEALAAFRAAEKEIEAEAIEQMRALHEAELAAQEAFRTSVEQGFLTSIPSIVSGISGVLGENARFAGAQAAIHFAMAAAAFIPGWFGFNPAAAAGHLFAGAEFLRAEKTNESRGARGGGARGGGGGAAAARRRARPEFNRAVQQDQNVAGQQAQLVINMNAPHQNGVQAGRDTARTLTRFARFDTGEPLPFARRR